jgi:LuxR family maltose regulon positive regulatory protein
VGLGQGEDARAWVRLGIAASDSPNDDEARRTSRLQLLTLESMLAVGPIKDSLPNATRAYQELPAGAWHSAAGFAVGFLDLGLGLDDLAEAKLAEAASEARVSGTATIWAASCALLAVIHGERGDWAEAKRRARAARQIAREHGLENMPTMAVVTAMSAHVEAIEGDPTAARADMLLTRRNMAYLEGIGAWANVQSRLSLANASLLLGDRAGARVLVDEAEAYLQSQPDATGSRERLEEILERLETARGALPVGPTALTTAELRVLHLLPTNLSIGEIAQRLYVSRNTAKSHAAAVYRKFGVSSRGEAVRTARDVGLLPPQ